jgi:type IV pilus assembly protein PilC
MRILAFSRIGIIDLLEWIFRFRIRRQRPVLINLLRQLALMLKLDMPITEGLAVLTQDIPRFFMKKIRRIIGDIEDGISISEALKKHPRLFPKLYLQMIKIGEQSGNFT